MSKSKDIMLIYADENLTDLGVLQDYSFDECFGDKENNFECVIQKYNPALKGDTPITEDFILYIEFTEYGGIVDRVEADSKSGEVTLSGRTWHGVLNSFVIEPPKGYAHRLYQGEANSVIAQIISDIGMTHLFEVETTNSRIELSGVEVRYERAYDCIMSMLTAKDAKLIMWFQNGKVHLEAMNAINTGAFEEFDTSQTPFRIGKTYNNINDFVCMGQGNGTDRAIIHLYTDDGGGILPFCHSNPLEDADYYTDLDALSRSTDPEDHENYLKIIEGIQFWQDNPQKRYMDKYDYPNAEIVTNYKRLQDKFPEKPNNWIATYTNYYRRNSGNQNEYTKIEKIYADEYHLTEENEAHPGRAPEDWNTNYKKYYVKEIDQQGKVTYKSVVDLPESQGHIDYIPSGGISTIPSTWAKDFDENRTDGKKGTEYYYQSPTQTGIEYKKLGRVSREDYPECDYQPKDWAKNYGAYYTKRYDGTQWVYEAVKGIDHYDYKKQTSEPSDWKTKYGTYYFKAKKTIKKDKKVEVKKGDYVTVSYAIQQKWVNATHTSGGKKKKYPKWNSKSFYTRYYDPLTPDYEQGKIYYRRTWTDVPTFIPNTYYTKTVNLVPTWQLNTYYELIKDVEQIPDYYAEDFYYPVEDRFKMMLEEAQEKLKELADTNTLEINLELEAQYDVGDTIGAIDAELKLDVPKPIKRKIVKIKKYLLSVEYQVD